MADPTGAKRRARVELRTLRRGFAEREDETAAGSAAICARLVELDELASARTVMVFDAVPGEPDLGALVAWCLRRGIRTVAPDAHRDAPDPVEPRAVDVVIVPGLAFTADGARLGQGGGWYDRFLARCRPDCTTVGVCFDEQLVDEVPVGPHDRCVDVVVTPTRRIVSRTGPDAAEAADLG